MSTPARRRKTTARDAAASVGVVDRAILAVLRAQRGELGREPTPVELGEALGLSSADVRRRIVALARRGLTATQLTAPQERWLTIVDAIERPTTRRAQSARGKPRTEDLASIVALGLCSLTLTPAGRAYLETCRGRGRVRSK